MALPFVNRIAEQNELARAARRGGLLIVFGRRRVGKSRLLGHWLKSNGGMYSQAIEGPADLQLRQIFEDIKGQLSTELIPKSWREFFEILSLQQKPWQLCLDEFPYLTTTDPTLPSQFQKWVDHSLPEGCLLILAGSSTRMMNDLFLNRAAPLYGRAQKLIHVRPMHYAAFCGACGLDPLETTSFEMFSLVGGIPKYWEFVEPGFDPIALAEALYFDYAPYMEQEPQRILRDEGVTGINPLAVLEAVGRGSERPSEIAQRLGQAQTTLPRLFQQLIDASVLERELPFGESLRTTKKVLYRITDPSLRFWFHVYSPHRSRWRLMEDEPKRKLIHDHASMVFEEMCRRRYEGASRYWEKDLELDIVAPDPENKGGLVIAEVKWRKLSAAEKQHLQQQLELKYHRSALAKKYAQARFEIFDATEIKALAKETE